MPNQFRKLKIAGALLAAGAAWALIPGSGPKSDGRTLASVGQAPVNAEDAGVVYHPRAGFRYVYEFERQILLGTGEGKPQPVSYRGKFYLDVFDVSEKSLHAVASEQVEGLPASPVQLKLVASPAGNELRLFGSGAKGELAQQHGAITKDLLAQLFFFLPYDPAGAFDAKIEKQSDGSFSKTKLAYHKAPGHPLLLSSENRMDWQADLGLPKLIRGKESTSVAGGAIHAEASYSLRFKEKVSLPPMDLASLSTPTDLRPEASHVKRTAAAYHGPTWRELKQKMFSAKTSSVQLAVFGELLAYLRGNADGVGQLADLIKSLSPGSSAYRTAVGALATVGGADALSALRDAYAATSETGSKGTILAALTTTAASLDAATQSFLQKEMQGENSLSFGAAYALGASLQHSTDGAAAASAVAALQSGWQAEVQANSKVGELSLLDAMGNSGRADFLPELQAAATSDDAAIRAKAAFALRFVTGSTADGLLASALADSNASVQSSALSALEIRSWSEGLRPALEACASASAEFGVKCGKILDKS